MASRTTAIYTSRSSNLIIQILMAVLFGFTAFFIVLFALLLGYSIYYQDRVYPGVSVAGIDLSGLTKDQAVAKLIENFTYPTTGQVLMRYGDKNYFASPSELGFYLDTETSTQNAFNLGRTPGFQGIEDQFNAIYYGVDLPVVILFDQRSAYQYLVTIASQIDKPLIEADLTLNGIDVVVNPGQDGRTLDIEGNLSAISTQLRSLQNGLIDLVVTEQHAKITDATAQAELAKSILSEPLVLKLPDDQSLEQGPWTFEPEALAQMLNLERIQTTEGEQYQVTLDSSTLRRFLQSISTDLSLEPVDARYIFNDETRQLEVIQHAVVGQDLDVEASLQKIQKKILEGKHTIALVFTLTQPKASDDTTGEDLGITELIHAETSYFYGSSASRVQNIQAAASRFHGILVAPGETFSMAEALGDVSLDTGYAEALIIYGNQTIKGVGGGVCQVSTTLFRTVFFAGFPVVERHPHAYRVYYYEKTAGNVLDTNLAGLDATVYVPVVDFKFTNDSPYYILMETYVNPSTSSITWKFYSTSDGRSVEWETTGPTNIIPEPEPIYKENSDLAKGEIKQIDWGVAGADVTVSRTVYKNGEIYFQDTFFTKYEPWSDMYEYGPGTENIPTPSPTESDDN